MHEQSASLRSDSEVAIVDTQLVGATWGLVVVTSLLVIATIIPFLGDILKRRNERAIVAARTVPDMNILRSRLEGAVDQLGNAGGLTKGDIGAQSIAEFLEAIVRQSRFGHRHLLQAEHHQADKRGEPRKQKQRRQRGTPEGSTEFFSGGTGHGRPSH